MLDNKKKKSYRININIQFFDDSTLFPQNVTDKYNEVKYWIHKTMLY